MAEHITLWNGKTIPRIGIGTWVMGGEMYWGTAPVGWSNVSDSGSLEALSAAFDMGVRLIDSADIYGGGHSESIVGQAMAASDVPRDEFVVATKFGMAFEGRQIDGEHVTLDAIRRACEASAKRLGVDRIDLYQFHLDDYEIEAAKSVFEALQTIRQEGMIDTFGWSTNAPASGAAFSHMDDFVGVQHDMNIFRRADDSLAATAEGDVLSIIRQPLAMGLLSGKYDASKVTFGDGDIRTGGAGWMIYFDEDGQPVPALLDMMEQLRAIISEDGRSLAQGALAWVLAAAPNTLPIPGCRNEKQVRDNMGVIEQGPLTQDQMARIDSVMKDMPPMAA
ncbi:MAG: aldo/keto reductase [Pseudomonadota bacterium]